MEMLALPGTTLRVSQLVLGTGSLHHLRPSEAERLLKAAVAHGITHFDTAPYYGLGISERMLRGIAAQSGVTITTKVGLYSSVGTARTRMGMLARKALGKALPPLSRPQVDFTLARARASIEDSLKRLKREHIDVLMLHEPDRRLICLDEWQRWLETESQRVGLFGLAGEAEQLLPFLQSGIGPQWLLQTRDGPQHWEADVVARQSDRLAFTYGYLSGGTGDAKVILTEALARRPGVALIVSTRRPERVAMLSTIASGGVNV